MSWSNKTKNDTTFGNQGKADSPFTFLIDNVFEFLIDSVFKLEIQSATDWGNASRNATSFSNLAKS